jgi:hypothetical protein
MTTSAFTREVGTPVDPRNALRSFSTVRDSVAIDVMVANTHCSHNRQALAKPIPYARCHPSHRDYLGGSLHTLRPWPLGEPVDEGSTTTSMVARHATVTPSLRGRRRRGCRVAGASHFAIARFDGRPSPEHYLVGLLTCTLM